MHVISSRGVNDAWPIALSLLQTWGLLRETRNGPARVYPEPVTVVYREPQNCVLLDSVRDSNPFFSLFESCWLLAGRDDARWLDQFVHDFSARFAEPDGRMHGSYGKRWRDHFCGAVPNTHTVRWGFDQIDECVRLLRENSDDRQAVLQMWDPAVDLGAKVADKPCNLTIALRADNGCLDMTVFNRSNDLALGMMGANAVHMALLHEYLAARVGVPQGTYSQVSNNLHLYSWTEHLCDLGSATASAARPYPGRCSLVDDPDSFDAELRAFLADPEYVGLYAPDLQNTFLRHTAYPMWVANQERSNKSNPRRYDDAMLVAEGVRAPDWRQACLEWLDRRRVRLASKQGEA